MLKWLGKQPDWLGQVDKIGGNADVSGTVKVETDTVEKLFAMLDRKRLEMERQMISERSLLGAGDEDDEDEEDGEGKEG